MPASLQIGDLPPFVAVSAEFPALEIPTFWPPFHVAYSQFVFTIACARRELPELIRQIGRRHPVTFSTDEYAIRLRGLVADVQQGLGFAVKVTIDVCDTPAFTPHWDIQWHEVAPEEPSEEVTIAELKAMLGEIAANRLRFDAEGKYRFDFLEEKKPSTPA